MTPGDRDVVLEAAGLALAEMAWAIASSRDPDAVLDLAVDHARTLLQARQSFVVLVGADERVRIAASRGLISPLREFLPQHGRDGIAMSAITRGGPVWSADVLGDSAIDLSLPARACIEAEGYRAALGVPLRADGHVLGALVVCRDEVGGFSPGEVDLESVLRLFEIAERQRSARRRQRPVGQTLPTAHSCGSTGNATLCALQRWAGLEGRPREGLRNPDGSLDAPLST